MGKRGNFKIRSRRVGEVTIVITDHETAHVFRRGLPYHTIYHRWFAIRGTWADWCEFVKYMMTDDGITTSSIGELAYELDIPYMTTWRKLEIGGKERNYETEESND